MNDPESEKAMRDAMLYGTGFMQDGKRIAPDDVYVKPDDAEALAKRLEGVEITAVHANRDLMGTTPVTKANEDAREAASTIRAQAAEIERLREALRKAEAALADIAEGEPDPDDLAEKIWCKGRAAAAVTEARAALNREPDT